MLISSSRSGATVERIPVGRRLGAGLAGMHVRWSPWCSSRSPLLSTIPSSRTEGSSSSSTCCCRSACFCEIDCASVGRVRLDAAPLVALPDVVDVRVAAVVGTRVAARATRREQRCRCRRRWSRRCRSWCSSTDWPLQRHRLRYRSRVAASSITPPMALPPSAQPEPFADPTGAASSAGAGAGSAGRRAGSVPPAAPPPLAQLPPLPPVEPPLALLPSPPDRRSALHRSLHPSPPRPRHRRLPGCHRCCHRCRLRRLRRPRLRTGGSPQPGLRCHRRSTDCWSGYRWCCCHRYRLHHRLRCCRCCRRHRHRRFQRRWARATGTRSAGGPVAPPAPPVEIASHAHRRYPKQPPHQSRCHRDSCRSGWWRPSCRCCSGCNQPTRRRRHRRRRPGPQHQCWHWCWPGATAVCAASCATAGARPPLAEPLLPLPPSCHRCRGAAGSAGAATVATQPVGVRAGGRATVRIRVWVAVPVFVALPALPPLPPLPEELPRLSRATAPLVADRRIAAFRLAGRRSSAGAAVGVAAAPVAEPPLAVPPLAWPTGGAAAASGSGCAAPAVVVPPFPALFVPPRSVGVRVRRAAGGRARRCCPRGRGECSSPARRWPCSSCRRTTAPLLARGRRWPSHRSTWLCHRLRYRRVTVAAPLWAVPRLAHGGGVLRLLLQQAVGIREREVPAAVPYLPPALEADSSRELPKRAPAPRPPLRGLPLAIGLWLTKQSPSVRSTWTAGAIARRRRDPKTRRG